MPLEHPSLFQIVQRVRVFYPDALDGGQARKAIEQLGRLADRFGCLVFWENDFASQASQRKRDVIERGFLGMAQKKQVVEESELCVLYIAGVMQGNLPEEKMLQLIQAAEKQGFACEELNPVRAPSFTSRLHYSHQK